MRESEIIRVTAGIIVNAEDKILIAQRPMGASRELRWEFPGGKIEPDETPEECLRRELYEEFEIHAKIGEFFCASTFQYPDKTIELLSYWVMGFSGNVRLKEHRQIKWVTSDQLINYDLTDADIPVANKLIISDHP
jgi:8-oxo-dGTP diphosphatase